MINITEVPSTIVVNCGYVERITGDGEYANNMRSELDDAFDGELEILDSYLDFDTSRCFIVRFKNKDKVKIYKAFDVIHHMGQVDFCAFLRASNITCMKFTVDYCYFEIDTESG